MSFFSLDNAFHWVGSKKYSIFMKMILNDWCLKVDQSVDVILFENVFFI